MEVSRNVLDILGVDTSRIPEDVVPRLELQTEPSSWGVFVLIGVIIAIAALVIFFYQRELDTCPRPVKVLLGVFRIVVLLLMVLIFLGPEARWDEETDQIPYVVILRDASASMNVVDLYDDVGTAPDGSAGGELSLAQRVASATGRTVESIQQVGISRVEIVNALIERDDFAFLKSVLRRGHVRVIDFGESAKPSVVRMESSLGKKRGLKSTDKDGGGANAADVKLASLVADAQATDLNRAIDEALKVNPLAAIIVLTDGRHTASTNPESTYLQAAANARKKGVPIYLVGIGDPTEKKNLKVSDIYVRRKVWPDEPFEIRAAISSEGMDIEDAELKLIEYKLSTVDEELDLTKGEEIEERRIKIRKGEITDVRFSHTLKQAGKYRYAIKLQYFDNEESEEKDNIDITETTLEVVDEDVRVLLISGTASWDFQLVKNLLTRDDTISVSTWLQTMDKERPQEGDTPITKLPFTREELAKYHVVMMFDPDPTEFDKDWADLLNDFVSKQAGGFLYMAGSNYSGIFLSLKRTSQLTKVLPVRFDDALDAELLAESITYNRQAWPLRPTIQNVSHPIMRFFEDQRSTLQHWEHMPGVFWSFPTAGAKETTKVLLEHSDTTLRDAPRPLIVAGRYGSGSTVFMGINETFRWRRVGLQAEYFDRFWIQVVRYLVETRSLQGRRRGSVDVKRERYSVGDRIVVTADLKDAAYDELKLDEVEAVISRAKGGPVTIKLKMVKNQPGYYVGSYRASEIGQHTIVIPLTGVSDVDAVEVDTSFDVTLPNLEASHVSLNEKTLRDTAEHSNGKYFHVDEVDELLAAVPNKIKTIEIPAKPVMIFSPDDNEDRRFNLLLIAFVVLLGVEWSVRKACKLL